MIKDEKTEYLVQVTIIEARCLKPKNSSGLANPFVKLKCGNLATQATEVVWDRLEANWNQAFTFDGLKLTEQELHTTDLSIEVYSKNNFFGNDFIGLYSIGLWTLYKNANHEFYNVWIVLYNQDEDPEEAQGYLLLDAFIIGPNDKPPVHDRNEKANQDVAEEDEELNLDEMTFEQLRAYQEKQQSYTIIGKPMVSRKGFQLSVYTFKCENLALFDGKKANAFISARVAGLVRRTKTIKNNSSPLYNQKMQFPCFFPFLNDKILLRIWNERGNSKDDFIANIPEMQKGNDFFNLSKLISMGGRMPAKWINLYGIPDEERNSAFKATIKHPREGTAYMGRILLSFSLIAFEVPLCSTLPCNPFYEQDPQSYTLYCDIYQVKFLKEEDFDIAVWCDCRIAHHSTGFNYQKPPNKKGTVKWYDKSEEDDGQNEITLPALTHIYLPRDFSQVPDIFVNLYTGGGMGSSKRIGYIRVNAEEVNRWTAEAVPRWLHFKPLDMNKDSPGSVLINLQFAVSAETKRIFKKQGIQKKYTLYAHIVNGFELAPKLTIEDDKLLTRVSVEITDDKGFTKDTLRGRYPVWNEILIIPTELDWKLDFTPDIVVAVMRQLPKGLFKKDKDPPDYEEIGKFTVPVRSIKKMKKYPHYYNLLKNNEITGRVMALFYIVDNKNLHLAKKFGEIQKVLQKKKIANIKIFSLGLRNLDFVTTPDKIKYDVSMANDSTSTIKPPVSDDLMKLNKSDEENNFINLVNCYEFFDVEIPGEEEIFQIFPFIKINFLHKKFFYDDERFLLFNTSEYISTVEENKKKLYRKLFEQNLGVTSLDQEQKIMPHDVVEDDLINEKKVDDDEDQNDEKVVLYNNDDLDVINIFEKKNPEKEVVKPTRMKEYDGREDRRLINEIKNYKNMMIYDDFILECKPTDKKAEKQVMRNIRKVFYSQLRELRKIPNPTNEQKNLLLDLENKFRDAKKPQMNEPIFYGFEDISDEYNYGRDIFKDDVYETHPNLKIPYKREQLLYVPKNPFETHFETLEGYFKLGKKTDNIIKFNVEITFKGEKPSEKVEVNTQDQKLLALKKKTSLFDDVLDTEVDEELKQFEIFHPLYQKHLGLLYKSMEIRKAEGASNFKLQITSMKVRVYIYRCMNLTAQDNWIGAIDYLAGYDAFSRANAYLQIQVGEDSDVKDKGTKYVDTRDNYVPNTLSPDFYGYYELEADLPKEWKLKISVMSFNKGSANDALIGSTEIDLEDRYLGEYRLRELLKLSAYEYYLKEKISKMDEIEQEQNKDFIDKINKKLSKIVLRTNDVQEKQVPVEYRPLMKPGTKTAQGIIEMFVEILPPSRAKKVPPAKIERPPSEEYEIRLVIWQTRGLPYDDGKKTIDVIITVSYDPEGYLSEDITKSTDTHLGCDDGKAIFNWRMKFPLVLPCTFPRLAFNVMDFNTFSADDAICSCTISLKRLIKRLNQEGRLELKNKWIQLSNRNDPGEPKGEIKIDLYFLPKYEADQNRVGEAQDEPNHSPKLEKPKVGRGILDFLKGTWLDVTQWKFNFSLFGAFKIIAIVGAIVVIFVILFVAPGVLVK